MFLKQMRANHRLREKHVVRPSTSLVKAWSSSIDKRSRWSSIDKRSRWSLLTGPAPLLVRRWSSHPPHS
jgi:hypothetical protein